MEAIILKDRRAYFIHFFRECHKYKTYVDCFNAIEDEIALKYNTRVFSDYNAFRQAKTRFLRDQRANANK